MRFTHPLISHFSPPTLSVPTPPHGIYVSSRSSLPAPCEARYKARLFSRPAVPGDLPANPPFTTIFFFQTAHVCLFFPCIRFRQEIYLTIHFTASKPPIAVIKARIVVICILIYLCSYKERMRPKPHSIQNR